ncbi:MAG: hypothetical protein V3S82_00750 [Dehalococcoidia bacterium]
MGASRRILAASSHFLGWGYASQTGQNRLPVIRGCLPPSLVLKAGDSHLIDCSTFTTALVCYGFPGVEWDAMAYRDMQVQDATRLWSAPEAWVRHGLGGVLDNIPADGWGMYQSWVDDKLEEFDGDGISGGHQWLFNAKHGLRLHSSSRDHIGPTMDRGVSWAWLKGYYRDGIRGVALDVQ